MELRQLRSLIAVVEADFSVSRAAERLHLVQPAVSQHLKRLEEELGTLLFSRQGKRLAGLTEAGERVLMHARQVLSGTASILAVGQDHTRHDSGVLRLGATHTQARYVLPPVIRRFREEYPGVELQILQGTPQQLAIMAVQDQVDLAICTEALHDYPGLATIPSYRWNRCLIAPLGHPLLEASPVTLGRLCEYPIITYVAGFTGRRQFSDTFARVGLRPRVVLSATDTDIIKTYVREGMGVGIIAAPAFEPVSDGDLGMRDLSHLFPWETTRIAYLRDRYLRRFQERIIEIFKEEADRMALGRRTPRIPPGPAASGPG
ncbi:LysR substrate-binding domain-containing protein [Thioalbus denitrificans]|uniref:LysR family cys regulon transcriptional activator n=1 Tax=Thioalbus denitrificans TaxID=547122 RepID=A0A369C5M7_9GAMM|nr:LysR substrate-binding domain-containing protein [Thioalbus denitrificans]RCX28378.1 LysR family cys regulon transcriptional activator [Thioalbus denitrificans]